MTNTQVQMQMLIVSKKSSELEPGACENLSLTYRTNPASAPGYSTVVMRDTGQINLLTPTSSTSCPLTEIEFGLVQH
jgi:hypothetical protein